MCDNMLVNPSGIPSCAMGVDMNIELLKHNKYVCILSIAVTT
jgi:hypothetical protein